MIHDVDQALSRLLLRDALAGTDVEVVFEAPTVEWAGRRSQPTVNLYLYDIRENVQRREVMAAPVYGDDGRVTGRRPPPRRFTLSYLLTCWTQRAEDEHRLLSSCLGSLLRYDVLPADVLSGALQLASESALLNVALPPTQDRPVTDLWSALGGELKPSLDVRVTAPFVTSREVPVGPPVVEPLSLDFRAPGAEPERRAALVLAQATGTQGSVAQGSVAQGSGAEEPLAHGAAAQGPFVQGSAAKRAGAKAAGPAVSRRDGATLQEVLRGGRRGPVSSTSRTTEQALAGEDLPPEETDEQTGRVFRVRDLGP